MKDRLHARLLKAADWGGRHARSVPGFAALACAVVGVGLVSHSAGWALLAAVPFLLVLDRSL